jgi:hypothetical protein
MSGDHDRRFQINPEPLKIVPERHRKAWQELAREVALDVPKDFRRRWTRAATARVILAAPSESYEALARELGRTPGAVRYRRQAMIHLLRNEHGAVERAEAYREDPKSNHKHADYAQVDDLLRELGIHELTVQEQFALAKPLQQPRAGWRGDGTSAAVGGTTEVRALQAEFRRLMEEARRDVETEDAGAADDETASEAAQQEPTRA